MDGFEPEAGGMRARRTATPANAPPGKESFVKKVDIFNKIHDDYNVKTKSGGTLSLVEFCRRVVS